MTVNLPGGPVDRKASPDQIDRMVTERMRRASILYEPGRNVTMLVGEAALRNAAALPAVMRHQVEYGARLARPQQGLVPSRSRLRSRSLHPP